GWRPSALRAGRSGAAPSPRARTTSPRPRRPAGARACGTDGWLLVTERVDRREPDRPPGRVDGAEQRDAAREGETPREDAGREVRLDELRQRAATGQRLRGRETEGEADPEREQA